MCFPVAEASKLRLCACGVRSFLLCIFAHNLCSTLVKMDIAVSLPSCALLNLPADPACAVVSRNFGPLNPEKGKMDAMLYRSLADGLL